MLTASRLAWALGVTPDVIRHYTEIGLLKPFVAENGYRYYDETDVLAAANARIARSLSFSLADAHAFNKFPAADQAQLLAAREKAIEGEIHRLEEQLSRLREIRAFHAKTDFCCGRVEDAERGPIYSLYTLNGLEPVAEARGLAQAWMEKLPFTHISISISKDELNDPAFAGPYHIRLGLGVTDRYAGSLGLSLEPPVETVPGGRFLILYQASSDLFALMPKDLEPLLRKARELGVTFLNDTTGRLLAIEETSAGTRYFFLIRVRIGCA